MTQITGKGGSFQKGQTLGNLKEMLQGRRVNTLPSGVILGPFCVQPLVHLVNPAVCDLFCCCC